MASYATVPAADLESEASLLNSKPKAKTSLLPTLPRKKNSNK